MVVRYLGDHQKEHGIPGVYVNTLTLTRGTLLAASALAFAMRTALLVASTSTLTTMTTLLGASTLMTSLWAPTQRTSHQASLLSCYC